MLIVRARTTPSSSAAGAGTTVGTISSPTSPGARAWARASCPARQNAYGSPFAIGVTIDLERVVHTDRGSGSVHELADADGFASRERIEAKDVAQAV